MGKRVADILFGILCTFMICVPLLCSNNKENLTATDENRFLAGFPQIVDGGDVNEKFLTEVDAWLDDNIGFRTILVKLNARIMYHCFGRLPESSYMYLGPENELNYITPEIQKDYQHLNLKSEEELNTIADSYQTVSDYLKEKGIQYYYFQCWDKHSICPEQFPKTVNQYGTTSKTDQIVSDLQENTDINVVSPKQSLLNAKENYDVYSIWGDPAHWTRRGAYVGYCELMDAINSNNDYLYRVLKEEDYTIMLTDQGYSVSGIHKVDMLENFAITHPTAEVTNEKLTLYSELADHGCYYYTNPSVDNTTRVLIIGDSYFGKGLMVDQLAESFHETILITATYTRNLVELVEAYQPDIVINENAERCERTGEMYVVAQQIKQLGQ